MTPLTRSSVSAAAALAITLAAGGLLPSCASAPHEPPAHLTQASQATQESTTRFEWPRKFKSEEAEVTVYQPQIEAETGGRVIERAAVTIQKRSSAKPAYGRAWMSARTRTDSKRKIVTFEEAQVTRASFPSSPELAQPALEVLRKNVAKLFEPVQMAQYESRRALAKAESAADRAPALENGPPKILFSDQPSLLVLIDGKPALRAIGDDRLLRVINTRALLLFEPKSANYFLYLRDRWLQAPGIEGTWVPAESPPSSLERAKQIAERQNQVDLLDRVSFPNPKVYVATEPTELIQTEGPPGWQTIGGTRLLFAENSQDDIFLNERDQDFYLLVSGRWYRASSLDGPWSHVPSGKLPKDFSRIPENHRKGSVLVSVAGTPQAKEALIANEVPEMAKVERDAKLKVDYDGTPQFKPIQGTSLRYAVNTAVPVIEVNPDAYYAVRAGVWFQADSPEGPWKVASDVPAAIYDIPPSSPLYYVTFVRSYGSTPEYVYFGYTPGYLGTYASGDGVVVYGTGYAYPPWTGSVWFGMGVTFGFYPWWGPWWGPWWAAGVWPGYYYSYPYPVVVKPAPSPEPNLYTQWGGAIAATPHPEHFNEAYVGQPGWGGTVSTPEPETRQEWNPPPSAPGAGQWGPVFGGGIPGGAVPVPPPAAPPAAQSFPGQGWGAKR